MVSDGSHIVDANNESRNRSYCSKEHSTRFDFHFHEQHTHQSRGHAWKIDYRLVALNRLWQGELTAWLYHQREISSDARSNMKRQRHYWECNSTTAFWRHTCKRYVLIDQRIRARFLSHLLQVNPESWWLACASNLDTTWRSSIEWPASTRMTEIEYRFLANQSIL